MLPSQALRKRSVRQSLCCMDFCKLLLHHYDPKEFHLYIRRPDNLQYRQSDQNRHRNFKQARKNDEDLRVSVILVIAQNFRVEGKS